MSKVLKVYKGPVMPFDTWTESVTLYPHSHDLFPNVEWLDLILGSWHGVSQHAH